MHVAPSVALILPVSSLSLLIVVHCVRLGVSCTGCVLTRPEPNTLNVDFSECSDPCTSPYLAEIQIEFLSLLVLQGVMPTKEEIEQKTHLAEARDKLVKLIVSSIMNFRTNSIPAAAACLRVLSTLVHNVLSSPEDAKMRQVLSLPSSVVGNCSLCGLCPLMSQTQLVRAQVKVAGKAFSTKVAAVDGESN